MTERRRRMRPARSDGERAAREELRQAEARHAADQLIGWFESASATDLMVRRDILELMGDPTKARRLR